MALTDRFRGEVADALTDFLETYLLRAGAWRERGNLSASLRVLL